MAPLDFSQDGAAGGFGGGTSGGNIGPKIVSDPGPGATSGAGAGGALAQPGTGSSSGSVDYGGLVGGPFTSRGPVSSPSTPTPSFGGGFGPFSSPSKPASSPGALPSSLGDGYGGFGGGAAPSSNSAGPLRGVAPGLPFAFDDGGSMPDTSNPTQGNDLVSLALTTVDNALQWGRNKYGLGDGGGQQMAMNDHGFRKSGNIEDRRDSDPTAGQAPGNNFRTNADRVGDKFNDWQAGRNPASQALGINDVPPMAIPHPGDGGVGAQGPGPQGADQQGAIPDDEQETA